MSMFHELMMRKKEETLYPVIKGSLTESPEGVFSGFSASNYLQDSNFFDVANATSFESVIKFTTGSTVAQQQGGAGIGFSYFGFYINSAGNLKAPVTCVKSGSNTSSDPTILTGLSANTTYWVKVVFANGTITWKTSTDGINWNTSTTDTIDSLRLPGSSVFVVGKTSHGVFNGSIDLNNTYYIINGTKYNLQAVVGYTIVGSPTIVDGVVSGFSSENYLTLPSLNGDNLEIVIDFTTGASFNYYETIFRNSQIVSLEINQLRQLVSYNWQTSDYVTIVSNIQYNTNYRIKIKKNNDNIIFYCSVNGGSFVQTATMTTNKLSNSNINMGNSAVNTGRYCIGTINLNETYIKKDNKLWFNGQPA